MPQKDTEITIADELRTLAPESLDGLTDQHLTAIDQLLCGISKSHIAVALDIQRKTLWRWEQKSVFVKALGLLRKARFDSAAASIDYSLIAHAKAGSYPHQHLYYKLKGELVDRKDFTSNGEKLTINVNLTDDDS